MPRRSRSVLAALALQLACTPIVVDVGEGATAGETSAGTTTLASEPCDPKKEEDEDGEGSVCKEGQICRPVPGDPKKHVCSAPEAEGN